MKKNNKNIINHIMNTPNSEENKSKSGSISSESEKKLMRKKISEFIYPKMPINCTFLRNETYQKIRIAANLFEIKFIDEYHKLTLFNIEIFPTIAEDNFPLKRQINNYIESSLPKSFKKTFFGGNILITFIIEDKNETYDIENIEFQENINNQEYKIKLSKLKEVELKKVNNFSGHNKKIKTYIEVLFRNIIMKNPNIIKFKDRTLFEIDPKNITNLSSQGAGNIFRGYITSANITENGLYMLINNVNKVISGKTALQKMLEIRKRLENERCSMKEIQHKINEYFSNHKTVLTTYGSLRSYRIQEITFDKTPKNTDFYIFDINGKKITVNLINYYNKQYGIKIVNINQPLIIAENNFKNKSIQSDQNYIIYLVPELVYITGNEDENTNDRRNKGRNILNKTKMDPTKKMSIINGIFSLYNSNKHKTIKKKSGQEIEMKSPQDLIKEWGINLGNNLVFEGRRIPQPKIYFKNKFEIPRNGIFRANNPLQSKEISNNNIFYIYDKSEHNIDHRNLFINLLKKCKDKGFRFINEFNPHYVPGFGLENTDNWESIEIQLRNLDFINEQIIGIIFCNGALERHYQKLKNYFLKQRKIPTQHIITRNIDESKRGKFVNSILYNIVDQMNIKMGGKNYYINFQESEIIKNHEVFLVIGLDSKTSNKKITYSMTSTNNPNLYTFITQELTCDYSIKDQKYNTLKRLFKNAIEELKKSGCPKSPDYIIVYRQGGNEYHNKRLAINEVYIFTELLNELRENNLFEKTYNYKNSKFYYICCNLKSNLKFFEVNENNKSYYNPKSGLVVDDFVTQNDKYEFYLQPQFVNQGTATPCHYEVMYYDKNSDEENSLRKENLEKLSFYLAYYYWTWSGAIRTPAMLKMSSTALDFYNKCLLNEDGFSFDKPYYI